MQKLKLSEDGRPGKPRALVIGGGVGGIRAALDLAESRRDVVLIDKSYSIGGIMTQLDRTFPTNNCDLCSVSSYLSQESGKAYFDIKPMTRLERLEGEAGNFTATLVTEPRFIDIDKCTACGECARKFPEAVRFTPGLDPRAPTCMRYPQATPYAYSIDMGKVDDIAKIQEICKANAIVPDDEAKEITMDVASVVLSMGAELFEPSVLDNYGGGKFDNVVTGLEYERIMSASGPFQGNLVRRSDQQKPKRVAWIQCVGSRGINRADVPYCSSVCCMYALKEAMVTKERFGEDIEATIFYMDMRTHGKGYEALLDRAKNEMNVEMVRCKPHTITEDPETRNLSITYAVEDNGGQQIREFDMVVLSTGFRMTKENVELAGKLGIDLNEHQFAATDPFNPAKTSKPGVYVCGVYESPKDIPETMVQASAAACLASGDIPGGLPEPEEENLFPPERDVTDEDPKIGVFICDCDGEIGSVLDINKIVEYAGAVPDVAIAKALADYGCTNESMAQIESLIKENNLNRVVIGGTSPRTHEIKFQDLLRRAGLNKYLLEMVNLRDQVAWAHAAQPEQALEKAVKLIQVGIAGVRSSRPLADTVLPMTRTALVVGGGVTGMSAALELADQGVQVHLVEQDQALGGLARSIAKTIEGESVAPFVKDLSDKVTAHDKIELMTGAKVVEHYGVPGKFTTSVLAQGQDTPVKIEHGVAILATGALANRPVEYGLNQYDQVVTQLDLDGILENDPDKAKAMDQVVMIQCVGSREGDNPNCSRICCQAAMKNALRLKKINPDIDVFVLYRDIRTYGFMEDYYRQARNLGVQFIRFTLDSKPVVEQEDGQLTVQVYDGILGMDIKIPADCVALSTGPVANVETTKALSTIFHVPTTEDNFFLEDHIKLRPVDMALKGFFVAGTAHSPKLIRESITQADAVAGRALTFLAKGQVNLGAAVATVDGTKCAACLICVRACPFDVPVINAEGYSQIDPDKCQGCGVCAAECPAKAIQLSAYEDDQILAKLDGLFERYN